jgi:hypothetical protein
MSLEPGVFGFSIQTRNVVAPISGVFGLVFQDASNLLILISDETGEKLAGVTIEYIKSGDPISVKNSQTNTVYTATIPTNTTTAITISKAGYIPQTFNVTIAPGNFLVIEKILVLNVTRHRIINRRLK